MHSNGHLGFSLSGMLQLGAAIGNLDYALGARWPWKRPEDADSEPAASADGTTLTDLAGAR